MTINTSKKSDIAIVGMDARFGPWQSLRSFQERVLGDGSGPAPTLPENWWGARESEWFTREGYSRTPFSGHYLGEVTNSAEQFRIPPKEMEEMLPQQLLMLQSGAAALADAGIGREGNLNAGVFIGIALDLSSTNFSFRWSLEEQAKGYARELGVELTEEEMQDWLSELKSAAYAISNSVSGIASSLMPSVIVAFGNQAW